MVALQSLLVLVAVSAPGDTTLLEFSSTACPACAAVDPIVKRLAAEGNDVRQIDANQQREVAQQYRIRMLPTFVVLRAGQEVERIEGASSYDRLVQAMRVGELPSQQASPLGVPPVAAAPSIPSPTVPTFGVEGNNYQQIGPSTAPTVAAAVDPMRRAMYATVRLKVEDNGGFGYGTGTIIDRHDGEALVVTCGHIFRESQGKGTITADLFAPGAAGPVAGQMIAYDLDRDIALVSLRLNMEIEAVPVGGAQFAVKPHDAAFSIGCDKGAAASIRETKITGVNKYKGPPNFTAAGQPVEGRSGGGLFSADGHLIGICNAADPADDEGLYAALGSIHWQLDQIGQQAIYQKSNAAAGLQLAGAQPGDSRLMSVDPNLPQLPQRMPAPEFALNNPSGRAQLAPAPAPANDTQMIVMLRSRSNPQQQEVLVVEQPSPQLLQQLGANARPADATSAATLQAATRAWDAGRTAMRNPAYDSPIVRGQAAE